MKLNFELPEKVKLKVLQSLMTDILYAVPLGMDVTGQKRKESWFVIGTDKWLTVQDGEIEKVEYIAHCKDFLLKPMVGNAYIKATVDGRVSIIARFSMTDVVRYGYIVQILNQMAANQPVKIYNNDNDKVCPICGRILIRGTNLCPKCSKKGQAVKQIVTMAKPYMIFMVISLIIYLITTVLSLKEVTYYQKIVDECFGGGGTKEQFFKYMFIVIGLGLGAFFLNIVAAISDNNFTQRFAKRLRKAVFDKVQSLSVSYVSNASPGDIMNRTFSDTNEINTFIRTVSVNLIKAVFLFIVATVMMLQMNWKMALVIMIPAPLAFYIQIGAWNKFMKKVFKGLRVANDKANSYLHDVVSGIRVVKVFGTEKRVTAKFRKLARNVADQDIKGQTLVEWFGPLTSIILYLGQYAIYFFGCMAILGETMTLGELVAFNTIAQKFYAPLNQLILMPRQIANSMISVQRVYEILNQVPEIRDQNTSTEHKIEGNIEFQGVSFGYNSYDHVLNDINFTVKKGEMIGLVGRSGSGKSTLTNLVCRFYDVNEGSIKIDGKDIRDIQQSSLTSQIGVVLQENFLFSGPLFENLRYSKPNATPEEVIRAAKIANAHEFIINLPDGYDTWVAEGGSNFSGGEKQRIAIARAILSDPAILILDEATSALDVETEAQIQEALQRLIEGRTTFAIAHRLSTLKNANRLFVMDKGKIVEMGTHDELLKKKGIYYSLVMAQRTMAKRKGKTDTVSEILAN